MKITDILCPQEQNELVQEILDLNPVRNIVFESAGIDWQNFPEHDIPLDQWRSDLVHLLNLAAKGDDETFRLWCEAVIVESGGPATRGGKRIVELTRTAINQIETLKAREEAARKARVEAERKVREDPTEPKPNPKKSIPPPPSELWKLFAGLGLLWILLVAAYLLR